MKQLWDFSWEWNPEAISREVAILRFLRYSDSIQLVLEFFQACEMEGSSWWVRYIEHHWTKNAPIWWKRAPHYAMASVFLHAHSQSRSRSLVISKYVFGSLPLKYHPVCLHLQEDPVAYHPVCLHLQEEDPVAYHSVTQHDVIAPPPPLHPSVPTPLRNTAGSGRKRS